MDTIIETKTKTLTRAEARTMMLKVVSGNLMDDEIESFLRTYINRQVTVGEILGFRDALLEVCVRADFGEQNTIDLCGTGGDGKDTFNISTLTSLVVAGAGYKVTKHGNYASSSKCGSSNVMEFLGYKFSNSIGKLRRELDETNICFLHAPLFHPAMKNVAPVRRKMGVKTIFNMLGPLVNPANPAFQFTGVYGPEVAEIYKAVFMAEKKRFSIVHSIDGYDEISLTGPFTVATNESISLINPENLSLPLIYPKGIKGGVDVESSAHMFKMILEGSGTISQNHAVTVNAAYAIQCIDGGLDIRECLQIAEESLLSGEANNKLNTLINIQNEFNS